jgi:hypothetical protein
MVNINIPDLPDDIFATNEEFEDTKRVIRIRIKKNRQHNGQKKKVQKDKNKL